jgi:hypothetical protein
MIKKVEKYIFLNFFRILLIYYQIFGIIIAILLCKNYGFFKENLKIWI